MISLKARAVLYASVLVAGSAVACAIRFTHAPVASVPVHVSMAPALQGNEWINLDPATKGRVLSLKGHVTVLHFWTFECINCEHNLPYYDKWQAAYKPEDVQAIGIHTPELPDERDPVKVRAAVKRLGITYPVLIDGEERNWSAYHQEYWPAVYLIDKNGQIRDKFVGELGDDGFAQASKAIEKLRKE